MYKQNTKANNTFIYYRLVALWALAEGMLGGIIHGLKIPVSGLVVGSCAVICICLIAWYVPAKGAIIKATIIVAVFKMLLSPQAPLPAYIAVFFQGLLGELLFWNRRFFRVSCILLAVLSLLESGFQRILMLTIIYGNELWTVINNFVNGLTKQKVATNYSLLIGGSYVMLHLVAGLAVGWWASVLPARVAKWRTRTDTRQLRVDNQHSATAAAPLTPRRRKGWRKALFAVWVVLVLLYAQSYFRIGRPLLPPHVSLKILIRSFIIVLTWYFMVSPLLKKVLHNWLHKKSTHAQSDIQKVLELLPDAQWLVSQSWKASAKKKGWSRLIAAGKMILVHALHPVRSKQLFILTGPIQSGKTSSLVNLWEKRDDVFGILTPVVDGKRVFMNVHTREQFPMEAAAGEKETLAIGRFVFSKNNFDKAAQVIHDALHTPGWLVIDEIGPIELRGEGFHDALRNVLTHENRNQEILLVVREGMAEKVKASFYLDNVVVINGVSEIQQ